MHALVSDFGFVQCPICPKRCPALMSGFRFQVLIFLPRSEPLLKPFFCFGFPPKIGSTISLAELTI